MFLAVGTVEKMLKARTIDGAYWRYLERFSRSWNGCDNLKSKQGKWCILALFKTIFWNMELLRKNWKQGS